MFAYTLTFSAIKSQGQSKIECRKPKRKRKTLIWIVITKLNPTRFCYQCCDICFIILCFSIHVDLYSGGITEFNHLYIYIF